MMPMTSRDTPFTWIDLPMIPESAPNRDTQSRWLRIAALDSWLVVSFAVKPRGEMPLANRLPYQLNALTQPLLLTSGMPSPVAPGPPPALHPLDEA